MATEAGPAATVHGPSVVRGLAYAFGIAFIWGLQWPAIKIALGELGPWTYRAVATTGAGAVMLLALRLAGHSLAIPRRDWVPVLLIGLLVTTIWQMLSAYGVSLMSASRAVILGFTMPLWGVIFGMVLLGDRLGPARVAGLALGLIAMTLLMGPDSLADGGIVGGAVILLAAVAWALGVVLTKYFTWTMSTLAMSAWQVTLGSVPITIGAFLIEDPIRALTTASPVTLGAVAYSVLVAYAYGIYAWFRFVQLYPTPVTAVSSFLVPVFGVIASVLVLGDVVQEREWVALALVVAGTVLVNLTVARR